MLRIHRFIRSINPCHSLILDPEDAVWADFFTADELSEIINYQTPSIPALPHALKEYLDGYDNSVSLLMH